MKSSRKKKPDLLVSLIIAVALVLAATLAVQVSARAGGDPLGLDQLRPYLSDAPHR